MLDMLHLHHHPDLGEFLTLTPYVLYMHSTLN